MDNNTEELNIPQPVSVEPKKKKKKGGKAKKILAIFAAVIAAGICVLAASAYYVSEEQEKAELNARMASEQAELSIRRLASEKSTELEQTAQQNHELEVSQRNELTDNLLAREAEELLTLVNPWHPIPEDWTPRLVEIGDGMLIDERCAGALKQMLADCKATWHAFPSPISAYRTEAYQQMLFDDKVFRVMMEGWREDNAKEIAAKSVAVPGTSEHQLGFAVDISDMYYTSLTPFQQMTDTQQWLMSHCTDYGFILRYPDDTSEITGIEFEPWHYRYVGVKAAKEIEELGGITFEEYLELKGA